MTDKEKIEQLEKRIEEIKYSIQQIAEIYIGMDGFIPQTAPEAYQQQNLKEMYDMVQILLTNIM